MSGNSVDPARYAAAEDGLLDLILAESDKRVAAQVQLMLAADQRANGLLAGCITLAAAGGGFAISQLKDGKLDPFFYASLCFSIVEALAAVSALMALWPEPLKPQGWAPGMFATDLNKKTKSVKAEIAQFMQERIESNRQCASKLARRVKWAMLLAAEGPLVAISAGLGTKGPDFQVAAFCFGSAAVVILIALGAPLLPGSFARGRG